MMTFHTFLTKLKKCFDTILICNQAYSHATQVDMLLRRMKCNDVEMQSVTTMIQADPTRFSTFSLAAQEISKHVAILYPEQISQPGTGRHNKKQNASSAEKGHKIINKNGKKMCNVINVTDMTRAFSAKEWNKLPKSFKTELFNHPERKKKRKLHNKRNTFSAVKDSTTPNSETTQVGSLNDATLGRIISGVMIGQITQQGGMTNHQPNQQPCMGPGGATTRSSSSSSVVSNITDTTRWDHNGNIIQ
mmetsp:Transcript_16755/g.23720  ORF Transcript_16755/g.23720 Transcript_16755/m.23720 type:complete len:247 (+) Transcript_16755:975-1715(+)